MKTNKSSLLSLFIPLAILCCCCFVVISAKLCRDMPMYPDACCKIPKVAQEDEIVAGCMQTYGEQTVRERADANDLDRGCCIAECILNGTGRADLHEDNIIDMQMQKAQAMGMAEDWEAVIKTTARMCSTIVRKQADRFEKGFLLPPVDPRDMVCHPKYLYVHLCTVKEYAMHCPAKHFTDSPECRELLEYLRFCEM